MRIATVLAVALLGTTSLAGTEHAQAAIQHYQLNIPRQPLDTALKDLAQQTGLQIGRFSSRIDGSAMVGPVRGSQTPEQALKTLLNGTGLDYKIVSDTTIAVYNPKDATSSTTGITGSDSALQVPGEGQGARDKKSDGSSGDRLQLAQTPQGSTSSAPSVGSSSSPPFPDAGAGTRRADEGKKIEEIVVTATKRTENIQDVPFSIDVVTADEIDRRGLVGESDYLRGIPGVNQMETPNGGSLVIRGIDTGPEFQNFYNGPTVATYFGEAETTGTSINANVDLKLVDIARVEVLRGPQGTAFGNSTLGGAVRTIPVAPKLDSFEGNFSAGYSETSGPGADNYNFQAVANIPLIQDRLAIRAVAYVFSDSGYYTNLAGSDPHFQAAFVQKYGVQAFATNEQNVGGSYVPGARIAALFKATDDLRFTLSYITQKFEQNGWGVANSGTYEQTVLQVSPEQIERGQTGGMNDEHANIANALMEYDLKWADLVATYTHVTSGTQYVQPGSIFGTTSQSNPSSQLRNGAHLENVGEVRLVTKLAGAWNYIAGLYYEETSTNLNWVYDWVGNPALNTIERGVTQFDTGYDRRTLDQQAGFGEVSWKFLPQFTLTAGARAFAYHRTYVSNNVGAYASNPPDAGETESRTGSTYRANLAYKPNDNALVYAGFSQGFRLGRPQQGVSESLCDPNHTGFIQGTDIPITSTSGVNADSLDNYELGTKLSLFGHRLTIDADVFHMLWKDIPVSIFPVSTATNCFPYYLANAGAAKSDGAEFQANLQVTRALRADIGASYTNARLTQDTPDAGLKAGLRLPGSPKVNSNLGMLYDFMIGGHAAFVRADAIYVGPFYVNILQQPNTRAGDYVKLDASARISLRDDLNVDLYVHNATNNNAFVMRSGYALGTSDFGYRPRPRTVGMQLTTRF